MSDPVEEAAKLPLNQRLEHTHWKVRSVAYEELAKKYNEALESTSSIFSEYSGYFKKMMNDKNAAAMEKGLEPIYAFYDRYDHATKFTASLAPLIIEKCFGARQGTKQRAIDLLLLMVEVDTTAEAICVALVEGANNKVPKVAVASIQTLELVLKTFGVKVVPLKPIISSFLSWFDHTNADARSAAQNFTIELYRWVGGAILDKPISNLRQAQVTELQKAFADIVKGSAVPQKYLRCQVDQMQAAAAAGTAPAVVEEVDVFTMVEAVNLLSKITPDMYELLQSKKWKDKKETLEAINKIADTPRLASGDYGELVKNLRRLLGDANVFVVEESIKLLGFLARGLRTEFSQFAKSTMSKLLDKLKESNQKVTTALQNTFDAYHPMCFALADITEDISVASKHKVPLVKRGLLTWIKRALPKEKRAILTKSLKMWCTLFMELMDDPDSPVRENTFECFGLIIGIVGERSVTGFLNQLDKVKEKRVREFIPSAPIPPPAADTASSAVATAAATTAIDVNANVNLDNVAKMKAAPANAAAPKKGAAPAAHSSRNVAPPASKPSAPSSSANTTANARPAIASEKAPTKQAAVEVFNTEPRMSAADAEARVAETVPDNVVAQLGDKDWKQRLDAMSVIASMVERWDPATALQNAESLLLFIVITRPSFKEPNVQVLTKMIEVLKRLCSVQHAWNKNDVYIAIAGVLEHIHETKLTNLSIEFLNTCGENPTLGIQFVFNAIYGLTKDQKSPKIIVESLAYLTTALSEFGGALIEMKNLVTFIKSVALEQTNATIKATGIRVLSEVYKQMGGNLLMPLLSDVKPQIMNTMKKEFERIANDRPATPSRGPNGPAVSSSEPSPSSSSVAAYIPLFYIKKQNNSDLLVFTNCDWQKRQEAMASIESTLIEVRKIQPKGLSSLMMPLKSRLADSNINLIPLALNILGELATASGPTIESHMKTVMPSILACYANGKSNVRAACSQCLDKWVNEVGMDPILPYLPTALGTPSGRSDLLGWISTKLHYVKKGDVKILLKPAFQCYQDKTKEVRSVAETTLIELARRLTPKVVEGECSKLAPSILTQVRTLMKNMEAEIKKPIPVPSSSAAPVAKSKIPVPAALNAITSPANSSFSPAASPHKDPVLPEEPAKSASVGPLLRNNKRMDRELEDVAWVFDSPVPNKFYDTLREQMTACVTPDLLDRLFSTDAKSHSSAIADLEVCVDSQKEAVEDSLDVILKWCSLRLFHPNAAIIKRVVALIEHLLGTLDIWGHKMTELEAASFIPIVVIRLPHLNEAQQSTLRSVLQLVEQNFFAASNIFKLFMHTHRVWTGSQLTSESRVECLRYLGNFIRRQSLSVCDPSEAFRVFSSLLSEEDSNVVIAALNVLSEAGQQLQQDETLWQYISPEYHELARAYIASPTTEILTKFKIGTIGASSPVSTAAQPQATPSPPATLADATTSAKSAESTMAISSPAVSNNKDKSNTLERTEKPIKAQPVLEKVQIIKSAAFQLELDKLVVDPLPESTIPLPAGIMATQLPSHITAEPTPFLLSRQVSRTGGASASDAQAHAAQKQQSQVMLHVQNWITALKSADPMLVNETLQQIYAKFNQDLQTFVFHIEPLMLAVIALLKPSFSVLTSIPEAVVSATRIHILSVFGALFTSENYARFVPESLIKMMLPLLVESMLIAYDLPVPEKEKELLIGKANGCTLNILNYADKTACISTLLAQIREKTPINKLESSGTPASTPFLDIIKKCLSRLTRAIPTNMSRLALPTVLYELHLFFVALPPHSWPKTSDSALETVKALLEKLVEVAGSGIINYMGLIPLTRPGPVINWYIKSYLAAHCPNMDPTVLQSFLAPDTNPETQAPTIPELSESPASLLVHIVPRPSLPSAEYRLPSPANDTAKRQALKHVFQKIAKKETSQQGLIDLYWLKKDHADVDVDDFLKTTSQAFKTFITDHMKRFTAIDQLGSMQSTESISREVLQHALAPPQDANAQLSKLRALQSKLKLGKPSEVVIQTELEPSVLSAMAFNSAAGTSTGGGSGKSTAIVASSSATSSAVSSISGYRERLRNAASSNTSSELPAVNKFELPSLGIAAATSGSNIAPSLATSASQSAFTLPSLTSSQTYSAGSSTVVEAPDVSGMARNGNAPAAKPASQIPLGPTSTTNTTTSTVDNLRDRLARIKAAKAASQQ